MARRLIWSTRALDDLDEIVRYIAKDAPLYARNVARRVFDRVESLPDQPKQGRRVPEYEGVHDIREVFVHRWRVMYQVASDRIRVITIVHGARMISREALNDE